MALPKSVVKKAQEREAQRQKISQENRERKAVINSDHEQANRFKIKEKFLNEVRPYLLTEDETNILDLFECE